MSGWTKMDGKAVRMRKHGKHAQNIYISMKMVYSGEIHGFMKSFRFPNQICHGEAHTSRTLLFYHFSLYCLHRMNFPRRTKNLFFSNRLIVIKGSSKCLVVNIFSIVFLVYFLVYFCMPEIHV